MAGKFHLGWFLNFVADEWNGNWGDGGRDFTGEFYVEMARDLERARFDYVLIEDKLMVSTAYGGTMQHDLKHGVNPKHDPVPLAVLMANATTRLGVIPTMSTSFYPPFLLARLCSTVDHLSGGRFGWNVVTSGEDRAAQNFGLDKLYEHDERYARASEYLELVSRLWESWEPDAIVRDYETGTYADYTKVHTIDFEGKYFKSRGPLNTAPSPQYRPAIAQAGASPPGRELAAQHADTIVAPANGIEAMKAYRDDIHARMKANGRDPAHCKVLYIVAPVVGDTRQEALAKRERWFTSPRYIEYMLAEISSITSITASGGPPVSFSAISSAAERVRDIFFGFPTIATTITPPQCAVPPVHRRHVSVAGARSKPPIAPPSGHWRPATCRETAQVAAQSGVNDGGTAGQPVTA